MIIFWSSGKLDNQTLEVLLTWRSGKKDMDTFKIP